MNSFISNGSFSQNQDTPDQVPQVQKTEDFQATHQFQSSFVQDSNNNPSSPTESDGSVTSSQGSMTPATPNPANVNSSLRVSKDEDHKHPEVQSNSNIQNQKSRYEGSKVHQSSSAKDGKDQETSGERSQGDKIAYYKREIKDHQKKSGNALYFSQRCKNLSQADEYYEEHLRCQKEISYFHNMCGHMLSKQYKYEEALVEFQKASGIRSQIVKEYNDWATQLDKQRKESEAWKKYEDAEYSQSYLTQIYGNWGWTLTRLKKSDLAIEKYRKALEIDGNVMRMCKEWNYGFAKKNKFQEARKKLLSQIYRNWGYTLAHQEKYQEALEKYKMVEHLNFKETGIYTDIGYCYDRLGDQDHAVEYYRKAIDLNPHNLDIQCEAYYLWGRTLDEKGEHEEAIKKLKEACKLESLINERKGKKAIKCSNRLCLVNYKLKRYEEALTLYKDLRDDNHRYAYVEIYIGLIYAQIAYRQSKGEKYFDSTENEPIKPEENYIKLAEEYYDKGISMYKENPGFNGDCVNAIEKEIERNEKLLKKNPQDNDELRMIIATMRTVLQKVLDLELFQEDSLNNRESKVQSFENRIIFAELSSLDNDGSKPDMDVDISNVSRNEIDDSMISIDEGLVNSLKSKNADEQIANIEKHIESFKVGSNNCISKSDVDLDISNVSRNEIDDSMISIAEGLVDSFKLKNADEQIANIEKYIESFKVASKNWLNSYRKNAHQKSAISEQSLKNYIKLEISISSIYSNWGYQLSTQHKYEEAIAKFEEAKTTIEKLTNLCKIGSRNRLHNCYYEINKGYRIEKQLSGIYKNWGFSLSRLGRFEDAVDKSQNALEVNPRNALAYKNLGFALSRLGKDKEAIESYDKALKLKFCPDSNKISIYMGFSLTVLGEFAEARKIYEFIINDKSQEISIKLDAYCGWANTLDEEGDSEGAMNKLNEALELQKSSDKPDLRLLGYLGLLHYHKKEYKEAQESFHKIIDHDPSYVYAYFNLGLVESQSDYTKWLPEEEKSNADCSSLLNKYETFIVEEVSSNLSHQSDNKIDIQERLRRCQDDIDTYQRTITEIRNILKHLEKNKEGSLEKWDNKEDKYEFYDVGIKYVQKFSYLRHDYIDMYQREAQKIKKRLQIEKKKEKDLGAELDKMRKELQEPENLDPKCDYNGSLLADSIEMQGHPPGF